MFLKNVLATLVGLLIFTGLSLLVLIITITWFSASEEKGVTIADNSILHLKIDRPILERSFESPLTQFELVGPGASGIGLKELTQAVNRAANDKKIKGIYLEPKYFYSGLSKLKELRMALETFKESGKFIVAFGEYYTEAEYYLASVADEVYLPDEGMMEFNGLRAEYNFLKGTLDKLGIEPQIFRVGAYKSAVEPFTRTDMSPETREQMGSLLGSVFSTYISDISRTRSLEESLLKQVADSMLATSAKSAESYKLITETLYQDEVLEKLKGKVSQDTDEELNLVGLNSYLRSTSELKTGRNRIAVVFMDGDIVNGPGDQKNIGSEAFIKELSKLREDDKIKAVVLRINSPGGSSLASDVIWREIEKTKLEKPVIASMSDVAASGGYYLAMACDTIVAQPMTLTGSIGIFSMYFNAQEFLEDKLGVTTDVVKTGLLSDVFTISRPFTEYEKRLFQKAVDEGYQTFITKAAANRNMPLAQLDSLAGGRVWSGTQALENGLVDVIGGLEDAVTLAVKAAGIEEDDYRMRYYPTQKTLWQQLMSDLGAEYREKALNAKLGEFYPLIMKVRQAAGIQGLQTRMPFDLVIQ